MELLPVLLDIAAPDSTRVFVIDEIDRSLHTLLTRKLLETCLASCTAHSRSQLLFTTHDVLLMDQNLLRRDELWVAERDEAGASTLFSFSEFKNRPGLAAVCGTDHGLQAGRKAPAFTHTVTVAL